ncbi:MAG: hypothetical protein FWE90_02385 [Defluviitaleaceae bacterium]|nr:hypothetical protein [Defluviitaleaceae bacterium]
MKFILLTILAVALFSAPVTVYASGSGSSHYTYTYNEWSVPIPSPDAYRVTAFILGEHLGIGHFNNPRDLQVWGNLLYVADTNNNRIVVIEFHADGTFELVDVITHVYINGEPSPFNRPHGMFVSPWMLNYGQKWIADTENNRILHTDENWNVLTVIDRSKLELSALEDDRHFLPQKLAVDFSGRLFAQVAMVNRGLMEFDNDGYFAGYMGAPDVTINPWQRFWRSIQTREQRERGWLFVPVDYNNVTIDNEGFLFVTSSGPDVEPVRRLNAMGADVMIRNGWEDPQGDLWWGSAGHISGQSVLIDVTSLPNNTFVVFDRTRGRLFAYDNQGELLYAWGSYGHHEGAFMLPTALESMGFTLFALDATTGAITRFDLTEYGRYINEALTMYQRGLYEESYDTWQEVLRMNGNFNMAYIGVARALLRRGYYRDAMELFRMQNDNANYGRAFGFYRRQWMEEYFWMFAVALGVLIIVPPVVRKVIKVRREILES